jgi:hypothetical protein
MPKFTDYKKILSTSNPGDIAFIKSILDSAGITYFFQGENFVHMAYPMPARLMVKKDEVEKAKELLKDFRSPKKAKNES